MVPGFLGPGPGFSKRWSEMGRKASQGPPEDFRALGPTDLRALGPDLRIFLDF